MAVRRPVSRKDAARLWEYALHALGRRALSVGEMRQKLREKAERVEDVEPTIARLKEYGYLDDSRFAETYAAARLNNQGLGRMRVLSDLRGRRVTGQLAATTVDKTYSETDEVELVEQFLARKLRGKDLGAYLKDPNHLASAYRKLRYAGFGSSVSVRVLKRYSEQAGEIADEV